MNKTKYQALRHYISQFDTALIAFSGGIDSSVVAYVSHQVLGKNACAVTSISDSLKRADLNLTRELSKSWGMQHRLIKTREIDDKNYQKNPNNRCYFCKSTLYKDMRSLAEEMGVAALFNGTNVDDQGDYRPGLIAADKYSVKSPLLEVGYTKREIRELADHLGLKNANKPASACLASRVPYGNPINKKLLHKIERAESVLANYGFSDYRARDHQDILRIEINPDEFEQLIVNRCAIEKAMKKVGYTYITLDIAGFRSGSMNEMLESNHKPKPFHNIIAVGI